MVKAVAYLAQVIDALHNYAGIIPSPTTGAAPAEGNTPKDSQSPVVNSQAGSTPAESNTPKPEEQP
jgi:hypothetical protein